MASSKDGYVDRVRSLPLLSAQEERAFAIRWRERGDEAARNLLVQSQLRFVLVIARRYGRSGTALRELVAEGNLGLLQAANRFEPERGYRFVTYAKHWIRAYISEYAIRDAKSGLPASKQLRKARRELARASNLLGEGSAAERLMAERLELTTGQASALLGLLNLRQVSLESALTEHRIAGDPALCSRDPSPEQAIVEQEERRSAGIAVRAALATLNARERRIVDRRLMVDAEAMLTLKQLADEFGVSRERVRQLEGRLKQKLALQLRARSTSDREWIQNATA